MATENDNVGSLLKCLERNWTWGVGGKVQDLSTARTQQEVADRLRAFLSCVSDNDPKEEETIVLAARCNMPTASYAPWLCQGARAHAARVIGDCDPAAVESVLVAQVERGLARLRELKLQSKVDRSGRKMSHKLKVLGKLVGQSMTDAQTGMDAFKVTNVPDLGVLYTLIEVGDVERNWRFLFPYLLAFFDDNDFYVRREACLCLSAICDKVREVEGTNIIVKSQTESLLRDAILPLILSLPTLTPVDQALDLVGVAYDTLLDLVRESFKEELELDLQLSAILNDYLLPSMAKTQEYPELLCLLLSRLDSLLVLSGPYAMVLSRQVVNTILTTLMDPYLVHACDAMLSLLTVLGDCLSMASDESLHEYKFNVLGAIGVLKRRTDDVVLLTEADRVAGLVERTITV